jgi:nicotinamide mononucleotide adenylyltransferase
LGQDEELRLILDSLSPVNAMSGRFQPFHVGHLAILEILVNKPEPFIVAITNPDPTRIRQEKGSSHRHRTDSNPFTYFERQLMVQSTLIDMGVPSSRYTIVPLPINVPELWTYYLPRKVVHHMGEPKDEWEQTKRERFLASGHDVVIVPHGREIRATEIRERIGNGGDWRSLVPRGVATVLEQLSKEKPSWSQRFPQPPSLAAHP